MSTRTEPAKYRFGARQFLWKSHWTNEDAGILDTARGLGLTLFAISLGDGVQFEPARPIGYPAGFPASLARRTIGVRIMMARVT